MRGAFVFLMCWEWGILPRQIAKWGNSMDCHPKLLKIEEKSGVGKIFARSNLYPLDIKNKSHFQRRPYNDFKNIYK